MAVQPIQRTYNGRPYIFYKGTDDNGEHVEYIEEVTRYANGLEGRFYPVVTSAVHKRGKGHVAYILTTYEWALFDSDGNMVEGSSRDSHPLFGTLSIKSNPKDTKDFEMIFGPDVSIFRHNGFARKILGHNNYPVFNTNPQRTDVPMRAVIPMTPDQEAEAPTNDYDNPVAP